MQRNVLIAAALFGALSVIVGAWSAHGIYNFIPDTDPNKLQKIASFKTGVLYQFFHTFLLLFVGLIPAEKWTVQLNWVFRLVVVGVLLFSGSIYLLATRTQLGIESATKVLGPITPLGGLTLMVAWVMLLLFAVRLKK